MPRPRDINTRFDAELAQTLERFCDRSHRDRNSVVRAAVSLLLADGEQAAEYRLSKQIWDAAEEGESAAIVVAMREEHPAKGGRKLIVYTPAGFEGSPDQIEKAIRNALRDGTIQIQSEARGRKSESA